MRCARLSRIVAGLALFLATTGFSRVALDELNTGNKRSFDEEMLFLPNEKLLAHFTGGFSGVFADLLWLRTVHYTAQEFHNPNRKFTWLHHLVTTVTKLDPYYEDAYRFGGMLLAAIGADEQALDVLKRGAVNAPRSEGIPFEIAQVYLLNRHARPETPAMATHYLRMVAERSDSPEFYLEWIHRLQRNDNLGDIAHDLWEDLLRNSDSDLIREIAESKLADVQIRKNLEVLNAAVAKYNAETGANPENLSALCAAGILPALPKGDPGEYFLDQDGRVKNTMLLDAQVEEVLNVLNAEVYHFRQKYGQYPTSLQEWSDRVGYGGIPAHPYATRHWAYDAETGRVKSSR